jgi:ABC-type phosphate transport system substrate-binding protein
MYQLSRYGLARICAFAIVVLTALAVLPSVAGAALDPKCEGEAIEGQGSSLQAVAQGVWTTEFHAAANTNKDACPTAPKNQEVKYKSSGSGAGLAEWEGGKFAPKPNAFIGTDEPPNKTQKEKIESNGKKAEGTLLTIPVLQGAVAIIMNLPEPCTKAKSTVKGFEDRLVLSNHMLERIFSGREVGGHKPLWSEITENGDKLEGCKAAEQEVRIKPVVRFDQSGTTHIEKLYMSRINSDEETVAETKYEIEAGCTSPHTWKDLSEGALNVCWPKLAEVVRPAASGGGEEVKKVATTKGSIGYANLADARNNAEFVPAAGGEKTSKFWVGIQNNGLTEEAKATFKDPSTNGDVATKASANCEKTEYTPTPKTTTETWNTVTSKKNETNYTICGLSYDLAFDSYSLFTGPTLGSATTVQNYLLYVTNNEARGGQPLLKGNDYLALPAAVLAIGRTGAENVNF